MMKIESTVMIYVEMSINVLSQSREISNCGIPSVNQTTVRIDVGEDGKKKKEIITHARNCFLCHSRSCLSLLKAISLSHCVQLPNPRQNCTRSKPDGLGALRPPDFRVPFIPGSQAVGHQCLY